jgi:hypothetical protein
MIAMIARVYAVKETKGRCQSYTVRICVVDIEGIAVRRLSSQGTFRGVMSWHLWRLSTRLRMSCCQHINSLMMMGAGNNHHHDRKTGMKWQNRVQTRCKGEEKSLWTDTNMGVFGS